MTADNSRPYQLPLQPIRTGARVRVCWDPRPGVVRYIMHIPKSANGYAVDPTDPSERRHFFADDAGDPYMGRLYVIRFSRESYGYAAPYDIEKVIENGPTEKNDTENGPTQT